MKIAENDGSYSAEFTTKLSKNKKEILPIKTREKMLNQKIKEIIYVFSPRMCK